MDIRILVILLATGICTRAQEFTNPDAKALMEAERNFSRMAKETNTRDAFLHFFADSVVTSAPGQGPRVGKKHLEEQTPNDSWLYWEPVYADVAASGDFGFDFGPWEFRPKKTDASPVAFGQFISVWKKYQGEWKVVADIGVSHDKPNSTHTQFRSPGKTKPSGKSNFSEVFRLEKSLVEQTQAKGVAAYQSSLSAEAKFFRPGAEPYLTEREINRLLTQPDTKITYTPIGGDIAASGDLAFVYGKASVERFKEATPQIKQHSYMRIWKNESAGWKVVLDLISN